MASHMVVRLLFYLILFSYPHSFNLYISSFYWVLNLFYFFIKAGLGLPDTDAWYMIETIAEKNSIGYKQFVSYCFFPIFSFGVVDYFWILMSLIYGGIPIAFSLSLCVCDQVLWWPDTFMFLGFLVLHVIVIFDVLNVYSWCTTFVFLFLVLHKY